MRGNWISKYRTSNSSRASRCTVLQLLIFLDNNRLRSSIGGGNKRYNSYHVKSRQRMNSNPEKGALAKSGKQRILSDQEASAYARGCFELTQDQLVEEPTVEILDSPLEYKGSSTKTADPAFNHSSRTGSIVDDPGVRTTNTGTGTPIQSTTVASATTDPQSATVRQCTKGVLACPVAEPVDWATDKKNSTVSKDREPVAPATDQGTLTVCDTKSVVLAIDQKNSTVSESGEPVARATDQKNLIVSKGGEPIAPATDQRNSTVSKDEEPVASATDHRTFTVSEDTETENPPTYQRNSPVIKGEGPVASATDHRSSTIREVGERVASATDQRNLPGSKDTALVNPGTENEIDPEGQDTPAQTTDRSTGALGSISTRLRSPTGDPLGIASQCKQLQPPSMDVHQVIPTTYHQDITASYNTKLLAASPVDQAHTLNQNISTKSRDADQKSSTVDMCSSPVARATDHQSDAVNSSAALRSAATEFEPVAVSKNKEPDASTCNNLQGTGVDQSGESITAKTDLSKCKGMLYTASIVAPAERSANEKGVVENVSAKHSATLDDTTERKKSVRSSAIALEPSPSNGPDEIQHLHSSNSWNIGTNWVAEEEPEIAKFFRGVNCDESCPLLRKLTKSEVDLITEANKKIDSGSVPFNISALGSYSLPLEEWKGLQEGAWLRDNTISAYGSIVERRYPSVISMDCAFITFVLNKDKAHKSGFSKRYGGARYLSEKRYIFIPLNQGGVHWTLFVIDLVGSKFIWFDPMQSDQRYEDYSKVKSLRMWFEDEVSLHYDSPIPDRFRNVRIWGMEHARTWPKQPDSNSCGVFVLAAQASLASGWDPKFSPYSALRIRSTLLLSLIYSALGKNDAEGESKDNRLLAAAKSKEIEVTGRLLQGHDHMEISNVEKDDVDNTNDRSIGTNRTVVHEGPTHKKGSIFLEICSSEISGTIVKIAANQGGYLVLHSSFPQTNSNSFQCNAIAFPGKFMNKEDPENDSDCTAEDIMQDLLDRSSSKHEFCRSLAEAFAPENRTVGEFLPGRKRDIVQAKVLKWKQRCVKAPSFADDWEPEMMADPPIRLTYFDKAVTVAFVKFGESKSIEDVGKLQKEYFEAFEDLGTGDLYFTRHHLMRKCGSMAVQSMRPGEVLATVGWNVLTILDSAIDICMVTIVMKHVDTKRGKEIGVEEQKSRNDMGSGFRLAYNCCDFITPNSVPKSYRSRFLQACYDNVTSLTEYIPENERIQWDTVTPSKHTRHFF